MSALAAYRPQSSVSSTSVSVWSQFWLLDAIKITSTVSAGRVSPRQFPASKASLMEHVNLVSSPRTALLHI